MLAILTFCALIRLNAALALTPFTFRVLNRFAIRVFFVLWRIPLLNISAKWTVILVTFSSNFKLFLGLFQFVYLLSLKLVFEHFINSCLFEARMAFAVFLAWHVDFVGIHVAPNTLYILLNGLVGSASWRLALFQNFVIEADVIEVLIGVIDYHLLSCLVDGALSLSITLPLRVFQTHMAISFIYFAVQYIKHISEWRYYLLLNSLPSRIGRLFIGDHHLL